MNKGITKQYLRFIPGQLFGVVVSPSAESCFVKLRNTSDRYVAAAACENILVWDTKIGTQVLSLPGAKHVVTCLLSRMDLLASGYMDGAIRLFRLPNTECLCVLQGHRSSVSCLAFDSQGLRLASGGKDTEIVVWDVVKEAGLFRLHGHKGQVTALAFMDERNILISGSKDTLIKFWDLDTQHCFKSLVGHRSEVWKIVLLRNDSWLVTGAGDSQLRVFELKFNSENELDQESNNKKRNAEDSIKGLGVLSFSSGFGEHELQKEDESEEGVLDLQLIGNVDREGKGRVHGLKTDPSERLIICHGGDGLLELFLLRTEEEVKSRILRKRRKERKKLAAADAKPIDEEMPKVTVDAMFQRIPIIDVISKIRGCDVLVKNETAKIILTKSNNSLEVFTSPITKTNTPPSCQDILLPGHRSDVRAVTFSSDNANILSASGESLKIWNRTSLQCIRTIPCGYALSCVFVPGDRHCIIGTKSGKLQIFDINAGSLLEEVDAHSAELWSLVVTPDQRGLVTGSADKDVKMWDFDLVKDTDSEATRLTLQQKRTLQMSEDVLCVRVSADQRLLAASLLDSTVKVFFLDTLKFFLSLFGHKFPVVCMDISDDSRILVTGSADRNIKIWGLDFGDCHKSIFAHTDSIMGISFLPKTHMFFSCGKDKKLCQWDADSFQKICTLEGHQGEIWALAVSSNGKHVVTSSHDKSLRVWHKTEEPLILQEEQEMEREAEYDKAAVGDEPVIPGESNTEVGMAVKKNIETVAATEKLLEALEVYKEENLKLEEYENECQNSKGKVVKPAPHPLMGVYSTDCPQRYMLEVLRRIKSSELEEALLVLPFSNVKDLLPILSDLLQKGWETEMAARCLFFLLKVHCNQVMSTPSLFPVVQALKESTMKSTSSLKDTFGFNLAGLRHLQRELDNREEVVLFADAIQRHRKKKKKAKKVGLVLSIE